MTRAGHGAGSSGATARAAPPGALRPWVLPLVLLLGSGVAGCDGRKSAPGAICQAGQSRSCNVDGCDGEQRCEGYPLHYGACECDDAPDGGAPDAGGKPRLGEACAGDDDCPGGAFCLRPDTDALFGGGPPQALCVADCSEDAAACNAFADSRCVVVQAGSAAAGTADDDAGVSGAADTADVGALCLPACTLGQQGCAAVPGSACMPVADGGGGGGYCRPLCVTDDDCPRGACDVRHGACMAGARRGANFGTACEDGTDSCDGVCASIEGARALCSQRCVFGETDRCGDLRADGIAGGCLLTTGGIGDVGLCAPLCECSGDCPDPDAVCDPLDDDVLRGAFGAAGLCVPAALAMGTPLDCPVP